MPSGIKITPEQYAERLEYAKTHSHSDFALKFGMSRASTEKWYSNNGIYQRPEFRKRKINKEAFVAYAAEHSVSQAAVYFNVCKPTIYAYEKKYGVRCSYSDKIARTEMKQRLKRTGEMMDMIKFLIPNFSDASIARVFGYTPPRIRQIRLELEAKKPEES